MAFKTQSKILQKVIRFKALKWKDGKLSLWNVPGLLRALYIDVYQQKIMEHILGKKKAMQILYNVGTFQGKQAWGIISKMFGYSKKIAEKKKLLEFNIGQSDIVGLGKCRWTKMDFDNNIFILKYNSSIAEEYKRLFGTQKEPVDHALRGITAAFVSEIIGRRAAGIETSCIATGKSTCEFVFKPIEDWDEKDPLVKKQIVRKLFTIKEIGAKMETYLKLFLK